MGKLLSVIYKVELTIVVKKSSVVASWGISPTPEPIDVKCAESLRLCFPPKTDAEQVIAYLKHRYGKSFHSIQSVSTDGFVDVVEVAK